MDSIRYDKDDNRRIHEAILNDEHYQALLKRRAEVYNRVGMQVVIIGNDAKISVNKKAELFIRQINELIELRADQITRVNTNN